MMGVRWFVSLVLLTSAHLPLWVSAATLTVPSANYPTIQRAIYAATDGDAIQVAAGTYRENLVWETKRLQLVGAGAETTIIDGDLTGDGNGDGSCLRIINVPAGGRLSGFTFRNGSAQYGGGIYCDGSLLAISNCSISGNSASDGGGGFYSVNSSPTLADSIITDNRADRSHGAGIYCVDSSPVIRGNQITQNALGLWTGTGGGIACARSEITIEDNYVALNQAPNGGGGISCSKSTAVIQGNTIVRNNSKGGAGIYCIDNLSTVVRENNIADNNALRDERLAVVANVAGGSGGGVYCNGGALTLDGNTISGNRGYTGGGIWCGHSGDPVVVKGNRIMDNKAQDGGGGLSCGTRSRPAMILDNTFAGNTAGPMRNGGAIGGGINCSGPAVITGNAIRGNTAFIGGGIHCGASLIGPVEVAMSHNVLMKNVAVEGGGISTGGDVHVQIQHTTVVGNGAERGGGIRTSTLSLVLRNSIIAASTKGGGIFVSSGPLVISHCNVSENLEANYLGTADPTGINGNICVDPLFADPDAGDFHLKSAGGRWTPEGWVTDLVHSPCIDAGDPASEFADEQPPNGGRANMGAYGNTDEASKSASGVLPEAPTPVAPAPANEQAWTRPGEFAGQQIVGPADIPMVWVPGGTFTMGSTDEDTTYAVEDLEMPAHLITLEQPAHQVTLSGFWIGQTEVTVAQWRSVMGSVPGGQNGGGDSYPLTEVSWEQAHEFCNSLEVELPTEAQWEYAARGPEGHRFPWGDGWDRLMCCCAENRGLTGRTFPAGSFPAGASWCGALDMAGSLWEWCGDWYADYDDVPAEDPSGPSTGSHRVLRGGSWSVGDARDCRGAMRMLNHPLVMSESSGFRIVSRPLGGTVGNGKAIEHIYDYCKELGITHVALMVSMSYSAEEREWLRAQAERAGLVVVITPWFTDADTDMTGPLWNIRESDLQAVICYAGREVSAVIANNMKHLGIRIPLLQGSVQPMMAAGSTVAAEPTAIVVGDPGPSTDPASRGRVFDGLEMMSPDRANDARGLVKFSGTPEGEFLRVEHFDGPALFFRITTEVYTNYQDQDGDVEYSWRVRSIEKRWASFFVGPVAVTPDSERTYPVGEETVWKGFKPRGMTSFEQTGEAYREPNVGDERKTIEVLHPTNTVIVVGEMTNEGVSGDSVSVISTLDPEATSGALHDQ